VAVNIWPAMVTVPLRTAPVFAAAESPTAPFPLPPAPDMTVSHDTLLVAVHAHAGAAVTVTELMAPPPAATGWLVGLIE
jgi:hypothetical protein